MGEIYKLGRANMILQTCHAGRFLTLPVSLRPNSVHTQNGGDTFEARDVEIRTITQNVAY